MLLATYVALHYTFLNRPMCNPWGQTPDLHVASAINAETKSYQSMKHCVFEATVRKHHQKVKDSLEFNIHALSVIVSGVFEWI